MPHPAFYRLPQLSFIALLLSASALCAEPLKYTVLQKLERPSPAFTQGLEFDGEHLLESSGLRGQSFVRKSAAPGSDTKLWRTDLADAYFGEGLTLYGDRLYVLSWQGETGWIIDNRDGTILEQFHYRGQGWGLCQSQDHLIRSDGSEHLYFHHPNDFALQKSLAVTWNNKPVKRLNELECAGGLIWANIWQTPYLVAIDPASGDVVHHLDLTAQVEAEARRNRDDVLNGIAYHRESNSFWITGKRWRYIYQLDIALPEASP
ncbi:glutaminyl-peptide cyclotransferase [Gilvimarinus xylanilyticus]|uniref:Glutaminyl-peptide cyclotransferase n=1 Tax=Gilvimarinus xylanilyticus TaxID=2944139 RepID=A0A9X2I387_9GAMM|nr:glutaminyl-peptide cyclotransferase [Gilvimarinus xylanilyticus]MCP8899181.1 glutaminyl-peptide cyclotransferase [Gilvimarinus xylanilyticus]